MKTTSHPIEQWNWCFHLNLQVLALLYYSVSYFPGGSAGMKFLSSALISSVMKCFRRWSRPSVFMVADLYICPEQNCHQHAFGLPISSGCYRGSWSVISANSWWLYEECIKISWSPTTNPEYRCTDQDYAWKVQCMHDARCIELFHYEFRALYNIPWHLNFSSIIYLIVLRT